MRYEARDTHDGKVLEEDMSLAGLIDRLKGYGRAVDEGYGGMSLELWDLFQGVRIGIFNTSGVYANV